MGLKVDPPVMLRPKAANPVELELNREVVTISGKQYDITEFGKKHPGGAWISKFAGQDVTCLYESFHPKNGPANKYLKGLEMSATAGEGLVMAVSRRHSELNTKYIELCSQFEQEGLFRSPMWFIVATMAVPLLMLILAVYGTEAGWPAPLCVMFFGLGYGLGGFCMHHAGHLGVTGDSRIDHKLQAITFDFQIGMYAPWWRVRHNRHHAAPNDPEIDPDLETAPLLVWHKDLMNHRKYKIWNKKPFVKYLLAVQRQMFFAYLSVYTYFLHFASRRQATKDVQNSKKRFGTVGVWFNVAFMMAVLIFTSQSRLRWVLCWMGGQSFTGLYLGWIFALNHFAMPLAPKGAHYLEAVLRTTLNVRYSIGNRFNAISRVCDFMTGYLGYQVEHHLFPRLPACHYPIVHDRVAAWVKENEIAPFVEMSAVDAHAFMSNQYAPAQW